MLEWLAPATAKPRAAKEMNHQRGESDEQAG
jgi:hypothetical protein